MITIHMDNRVVAKGEGDSKGNKCEGGEGDDG